MHLWQYLQAIFSDWKTLMSGLFSISLAFLAAYSDYIVKHAKVVLWIAAGLCFILTSYRVWSRERDELIEERAKSTRPNLKGRITRFYVEAGSGLVCMEISLWNTQRVSTSIQEFKVRLSTPESKFEGVEIPGDGLSFLPAGSADEDINWISLDACELSHRPLTAGYHQGLIERDRWLCFVITAPLPANVQVANATLVALDVFDISHEILSEPPPPLGGRIVRA